MKVLLVAATEMETAQFRRHYSIGQDSPGKLDIEFLTSGVGALATAVNLCRALHQQSFNLVIQAGIAGSFSPRIGIAQLYYINEEIQGDLGVEERNRFVDIFDLKLASRDQAPYKSGSLPSFKLPSVLLPSLEAVRAITVNEVTTNKSRIDELRNKYDPALESMEGAALHYVGQLFKVPFVQIRAISNEVGERNKDKWKMKEAISNLNNYLIQYTEQIAKTL